MHIDSLAATSLETPKKFSAYLRGYASGFFGISASFRLNSQNAHDGTFFHHPAGRKQTLSAHWSYPEPLLELRMRRTLVCIVLLSISTCAAEETPLTMTCPSGFRAYERYCIPERDPSRPSMVTGGGCPRGYAVRGRLCVLERTATPVPSGLDTTKNLDTPDEKAAPPASK